MVIPDSVTTIGKFAFYSCYNLTSVTIPDSVTRIGHCAFSSCSKLTSVTISDSVTTIDQYAFSSCHASLYTEYEYGKYIGDATNPYAVLIEVTNRIFSTYTIHEDTKIIAYGVFDGCDRLTSITIPDSVTTIGARAFEHCSNLTSVTIPDSVTTIGTYAFYNCSKLTTIYYCGSEAEWKAIEKGSNWNTYSPATIVYNYVDATEGVLYEVSADGTYAEVTGYEGTDTKIVIASTYNGVPVTGIRKYAFQNNISITSVVIPDSVTTIGDDAFFECSSLTSVTIGNGVTTIDGAAFFNCDGLTSITIPNSVTTIGPCAFLGCSYLTTMYYRGSVAEWEAITKGSDWNVDCPVTIVYNYSES